MCMLRRRKKAAIFSPPHFLPRRRRKGKIEEWLLGSKSELACSPPPPPPPSTLCGKHLCSFRSFSFYPRARVLARALLYHADACTSLVPDWRFFFSLRETRVMRYKLLCNWFSGLFERFAFHFLNSPPFRWRWRRFFPRCARRGCPWST